MNKDSVIKLIIEDLSQSVNLLLKAAQASHAEATHESSKAENKYDTRGLEAAYLAGGQSRQAKEILDSIKLYESLIPHKFAAGEPIDLTALIELDTDGTRALYFVGPKSGGLEVTYHGQGIVVITPQSPLGQQLMGRKQGERWKAKIGGTTVKYHVVSVL